MIETGSPVFDDSGEADHYEINAVEARFRDGRIASIGYPKGLYAEYAAAQSGPWIPAKCRATKPTDGNTTVTPASSPDNRNFSAEPTSRT